jgi:hypothetical protein
MPKFTIKVVYNKSIKNTYKFKNNKLLNANNNSLNSNNNSLNNKINTNNKIISINNYQNSYSTKSDNNVNIIFSTTTNTNKSNNTYTINKDIVRKKTYYFKKNGYSFNFNKIINNNSIIYKINLNKINNIILPLKLYTVYNDNFIYNILINIIKNTNSLTDLIYQWNNIFNIIQNTYNTCNKVTFINNIKNLSNSLIAF